MKDEALKERLRLLRQGKQPEAATPNSSSSPPLNTSAPRTKPRTAKAITPQGSATSSTSPEQADPDQDLIERLRKLHSQDASQPSKAEQVLPIQTEESQPVKPRDEQDEIDALIQSTRDQLNLEQFTGDNVLDSYDADPDHLSDSDLERDTDAVNRDAADIVNAVRDELALERRSAVTPTLEEPEDSQVAEPQNQPTMVCSNSEIEQALADASQDSNFFASNNASIENSQPQPAAGPSKGRRNFLDGRFFFVAMVSLLIIAVSAVPGAYAFGAGNIPSFAYMEGKAFRHGDIEDILEELAKKVGGSLFGSSKFGGLDIKRTYFGNWLRDYSQAMDVASLQKMSKQAVLNIVMVLGFLAHGYATAEFQVTDERLGVYLPEEHLDNPKGYADGKDAREYDPRLREPINPEELEIDSRSGMKNYLANENGNWRTGSGLIRKTLVRVIETGRQARDSGRDEDMYEAYRLLGQALHTLEDFPAHSNWTELALHRLGHHNVFLHVGDNVKVRAPDGTQVAPIVTGTFGSADFIHSLLGEAQDHLSEASISDLNKAMDDAKKKSSGTNRSPIQDLLGMLAKIPGGGGDNASRDLEDVSRGPVSNPADMSPQEMHANLWKILELRDRIVKSIEGTIEKIPGLSSLVEKLFNELNIFVFTLIEPYAKPIMQQGMNALKMGSGAVINKQEQFEVFDNPNASDPTHSMLSKDHFGLILNEVAGNVAKIIVRNTVTKVVKAWDDRGQDPHRVADECLAVMFHPYWFNGAAQVQKEMMDYVADWARNHSTEIGRLSKQSVRAHSNTRSGKAEPHTHGDDQPNMGSFMGGGNSQAAHNFGGNHHYGGGGGGHPGNNSGGGGGSNSMGSQMAGYASNYVSNQVHSFVGSHVPGGGNFPGGQVFREGPGGDGDNYGRREASGRYDGGRREGSGGYDGDRREGSGYDRPSFPQAEPTGHDRYRTQEYPGQGGYAPPGGPPPGRGGYDAPPGGYGQQGYGQQQQQQQHPPPGGYGQGGYNNNNHGGGYGGGY
ncbi:hypothetical protein NDA18_002822 [Ustilago nuda]|nr:hypothetical protein NDA18_002822 [Ustilago nuda]